jgi:hypothetical protein
MVYEKNFNAKASTGGWHIPVGNLDAVAVGSARIASDAGFYANEAGLRSGNSGRNHG